MTTRSADSGLTRFDPPAEGADGPFVPEPQGSRIGRYVLEGCVGRGGMGVVYRARDPELDRIVAVKVLRPDKSRRAVASEARLRKEARTMARISHPNVLPVYDVGRDQGRVFLTMEYVEGITLGEWIRSARPGWAEIVRHHVEAGRGLVAAHAVGVVHRDFKPHNVLIGRDGRVRVMDFGLARHREDATFPSLGDSVDAVGGVSTDDDETDLTEAGRVVGTPRYMSPEQHQSPDVDARSDQFCFCASLYESLFGVKPFGGGGLARIGRRKLRGQLQPPPRDHRVPTWVVAAVARGLHPDPASRWPDLQALLDALSVGPRRVSLRARVLAPAAALFVATLALVGSGTARGETSAASGSPGRADRSDMVVTASNGGPQSTVDEAERDLAWAHSLYAAGRHDDAGRILQDYAERAEGLGRPGLGARATALRAAIGIAQGRLRAARRLARSGFDAGLAARDYEAAIHAATALAEIETRFGEHAEAARWTRTARALVTAEEVDPAARVRLLLREADVAARAGRWRHGRERLDRARALATADGRTSGLANGLGPAVSEARSAFELEAGDEGAAALHRQAAVAGFRSAFGSSHPAYLRNRVQLAYLELQRRGVEHPAAVEDTADELEVLLRRQRDVSGAKHPDVADTLVALASVELKRGAVDRALAAYQQAQDIQAHVFGRAAGLGELPGLRRALRDEHDGAESGSSLLEGELRP